MLHSEADLLEMIQSQGGQLLTTDRGQFWAIFDAAFLEVLSGPVDGGVETVGPALQCRTSDLQRLAIEKQTIIPVGDANYQVRRLEPDGTGMHVVRLMLL